MPCRPSPVQRSSSEADTVSDIDLSLPAQSRLPCRQSLWRFSSADMLLAAPSESGDEQHLSTRPSKCSTRKTVITVKEDPLKGSNTRRFESTSAEVIFCLSMAITQLLAEYLISGFSVILPDLMEHFSSKHTAATNFWPASILSLVLCSTVLSFARVSDMYGGYPVFMTAVVWLCLWTLIAGFSSHSLILLEVCRAMQGLAIAAYQTSTFALFGAIYPAGPRRNLALGIYGACAPLGFFAGICTSAALPKDQWQWYFWIASILAFVSLVMAYHSIPSDREDRLAMKLSMDWAGGTMITGGLILVAYALASSAASSSAWRSPSVLVPFILGLVCLLVAVYIEARVAVSPLIPFDFFSPRSVKSFAIASLFFYGSFGIWLFTSTGYLSRTYEVHGLAMAAYYTPMAIGGVVFAIASGIILHRIPPTLLLLGSGCAAIGAPLLLALANQNAGYWAFPFPSMICSTLCIDLTFTISVVFLSSVQPTKYQGLAGAVSSILVNMAMAFALAFATIVEDSVVQGANVVGPEAILLGDRSAFWFATASAAVGVLVVALFVRISRSAVDDPDGEQSEQDAELATAGTQRAIILDPAHPKMIANIQTASVSLVMHSSLSAPFKAEF